MVRLPTVNGDTNAWGTVLNEFLTADMPHAYSLSASTAIGATTIVVDRDAAAITIGSNVAVGALTTNCEVRRVTAVSGSTLTLNTAFKVAHTAEENVWVAPYWLSVEWWGARNATSSYDSYRSLINAFLDQGTVGLYGLEGRGASSFYSSRPLFINDYQELRNIKLQAFQPFGLDCTIGDWDGIPNQYFFTLAGQFAACTFNPATDEVTFAGDPGGAVDEPVTFYPRPGSTMPTGIEEGRRYFTITGSGLTRQIALSQGSGIPVDFSDAGSGEIMFVSPGFARGMWDKVIFDGSLVKALNGVRLSTQQPSVSSSIRIENFPVIGMTLSAQQGYFPNLTISDCWKGLEFVSAEFCYFPGGNVESCDINVEFNDTRYTAGANMNVVFGEGFHFESPGGASCQTQTLAPIGGTLVSGSFQLRFKNELSAAIAYDASAATIQSTLEAVTAIGAGNVTCTQVTGTNMADGYIRCDFTVGDLQWEFWEGSTHALHGGQMAVVNSTVTGGTVGIYYVRIPDGRNISFRAGQGAKFTGCCYSGTQSVADFEIAFIKCEGLAAGATGYLHGFTLHDIWANNNHGYFVDDDTLNGILLESVDTTGAGQFLDYYSRGQRHGGFVGQHWWFTGDLGRRVKLNTRGLSLLELKAAAGQTDNLIEAYDTAGTLKWLVDENGRQRVGNDSGPLLVSGTGTPEAAVTAPIGSLFLRTDGGAVTTLYVKESGAAATGWVAK